MFKTSTGLRLQSPEMWRWKALSSLTGKCCKNHAVQPSLRVLSAIFKVSNSIFAFFFFFFTPTVQWQNRCNSLIRSLTMKLHTAASQLSLAQNWKGSKCIRRHSKIIQQFAPDIKNTLFNHKELTNTHFSILVIQLKTTNNLNKMLSFSVKGGHAMAHTETGLDMASLSNKTSCNSLNIIIFISMQHTSFNTNNYY